MSRLSFFNKVVLLLNIVVSFCLILSYLSGSINPETFWQIALFGLAYPFLLILNSLFFLYWIVQGKKMALLSLLTILIGWNQLKTVINFSASEETINSEKDSFSIMSYNVRLFDLYNWTKNKESRNKIFNLIDQEKPDILCLQEFFHADRDIDFVTLDTIRKFVYPKNEHIVYTSTVRETDYFGIATFSYFPIIKRGVVPLSNSGNNICIYTDIVKNNDTLRIYNCHLASIHFGKDDYKFIEDIEKTDSKQRILGIVQILGRLKTAFLKRSVQAREIYAHMAQSPHPFMICGDFNDPPTSYTYSTLSEGLNDAFIFGGKGFGTTYAGNFPSYRIDYILFQDYFSAYDFKTIKEKYSDHYPILCKMQIGDNPKE